MAIIPRAGPGDISRIGSLPGVRNTTRVSAEPAMGLADAAAGLGREVLGVYEKQRERADNAALQEAKVQVANWKANWNDPNNPNGVSAYKGKDALGLRDAMLADYKKTVGDITMSMNPRVKQVFMPYADEFGVSVHEDINNYSNREHEAYLKQTHDAFVASSMDGLASAMLKSDTEFDKAWGEFEASETKYAEDNGVGGETLSNYLKAKKSEAYMATFDRLRATSDAYAARDFLDAHADQMTFYDVTKARGTIRQEVEAQQSVDDGDLLYEGGGQPATDGVPVAPGKSFFASVGEIIEPFGATITSTTGGQHNVGSLHGQGRAVDIGMGASATDAVRANADALMAGLKAQGYIVRDERTRPKGQKVWGGPHIHVELPEGVEGGHAGFAGKAKSEGEIRDRAIAMFGNTERGRRAAEAATRRYAMDKRDEAQRDGDMLDAMRGAVANAAPGTSVESIIGDRKDYATEKGWMGTLKGIAADRDRGTLTQTNPVVYDQFARMAAQFPREFATPETRTDILRHAHELATDDLNRLLDANTSFADPKKGQKAMDDWSSESERLTSAYRALGIDGKGKKDQQAAFSSLYRRALRTMILSNPKGEKPDPKALDDMTQRLIASFHRDPEGSTRNALSYDKAATTGVTLDDGRTFSGQDVADMQAALRRSGKPDTVADAVNALGNYR